jgi:ATP-dependent RNA helicase DeaD
MEKFKLQNIARFYKINMEERPLPDDEEMERVVAERITALLEARLRSRDNLEIERMQRFVPLARNLAQAEEELALIAMLLDDYYQQSLHAPPVQLTPVPEQQSSQQPEQQPMQQHKPSKKRPRPGNKKERTY